MKSSHKKIIEVISAIRNSFIGADHIYKNGSCWHFAKILKTIFPEGEIWGNFDHHLFRIGGKFYDITGEENPQKYLDLRKITGLPKTEKVDLFNLIKSFGK